jgi:hypothetical protein
VWEAARYPGQLEQERLEPASAARVEPLEARQRGRLVLTAGQEERPERLARAEQSEPVAPAGPEQEQGPEQEEGLAAERPPGEPSQSAILNR